MNSRGCSWSCKGEYDKAIADFTEVIRLNPDFAEAWSNRGHAWHRKGEIDKALTDFHEAIRLRPEAAITWLHRGNAWLGSGGYDKAIADYAEAVRLDPALEEARTLLVSATKKIKQDRIASLVEWFHDRCQDLAESPLPLDSGEGGYQWLDGGPYDAHNELIGKFPNESDEILEAAVQEIEAEGTVLWAAKLIPASNEEDAFDERLPAGTVSENTRSELNPLITGTPRIQMGPGFRLGADGILHLTLANRLFYVRFLVCFVPRVLHEACSAPQAS